MGGLVVLAGTIAQVSVDEETQQVSVLLAEQSEPTVVSYAEGPVTIEDEAGNRYRVDEQGQVTNEGAVAGTGREVENMSQIAEVSIKDSLVQEALVYLKQEINFYLVNNGKGPLDEAVLNRMLALPDCLSGSEAQLDEVLQRIDYYTEHREELIALIEADEDNRDRFHALVDKLNGQLPPYREGLTEIEWEKLIDILCPYLLPNEVIKEPADQTTYDYFVSDDDAWYREEEAPYKVIRPIATTDILPQGLQVALLRVVRDSKSREVAQVRVKHSGELAFTTLTNLSQVKPLPQERSYRMKRDYVAVKLPYASEEADKTYQQNTEFVAYKSCGDFVKVKEVGEELEGHWIDKRFVVATEAGVVLTVEALPSSIPIKPRFRR